MMHGFFAFKGHGCIIIGGYLVAAALDPITHKP
jgi:hypothetical protein